MRQQDIKVGMRVHTTRSDDVYEVVSEDSLGGYWVLRNLTRKSNGRSCWAPWMLRPVADE